MPRDPRNRDTQNTESGFIDSLYFAYGANVNRQGMKHRCPQAIPKNVFRLKDYQLVFRGVADIVKMNGSEVYGVLWHVTPRCVKALDRFEGYPYLYRYEHFTLPSGEKVFYYKMNVSDPLDVDMPSDFYFETIEEGYRDFGLPKRSLYDGLEYTYNIVERLTGSEDDVDMQERD